MRQRGDIKKFWCWIGRHIRKYTEKDKETLRKLYPLEDVSKLCLKRQTELGKFLFFSVLFIFVLCLAVGLAAADSKRLQDDGLIERKVDDGREDKVSLSVYGESFSKNNMEIEVRNQLVTGEALERLFEESRKYVLDMLPGENASLDEVRQPLNIVRSIPETSMAVTWNFENSKYILENGTLYTDNLKDTGAQDQLGFRLTYGEIVHNYNIELYVFPPLKSEDDKVLEKIYEDIRKQNEDMSNQEPLKLPQNIDGQPLYWEENNTAMPANVLCASILLMVVLVMYGREQEKKKVQKRSIQLLEDYPEIIYKIVLLTSAGMTMHTALKTIVDDAKKEGKDKHYVYLELEVMFRSMKQGISEVRAYEEFGQRCGEGAYIKLGTMMVQCVKKGAAGINELLESMAEEAMVMRKENARKKGEIAGTKLLMPMGIILILVFLILIIPAFLSINI